MKRSGTTVIECLVAASLLIVAMSSVVTIAYRVGHIWKDIEHQRIAMNELSNQLETLTLLSREEVDKQLQTLTVSSEASEFLDQAKLTGTFDEDEWGPRVTLQLSWKGHHPVGRVSLTGWLYDQEGRP